MQRVRHQKIKGLKTIKNRTMDKGNNFRAFVDLNVKGNAKGGYFVRNDLKEFIEKLEGEGVDKVVGVVYDGTYNLEILTQPVDDEELDKLNIIKGEKYD